MRIGNNGYGIEIVVDFDAERAVAGGRLVLKIDTPLAGSNNFRRQEALGVEQTLGEFQRAAATIVCRRFHTFVTPALRQSGVCDAAAEKLARGGLIVAAEMDRGRLQLGHRSILIGDDEDFTLGDAAEVGREVLLDFAEGDGDHIGIVPRRGGDGMAALFDCIAFRLSGRLRRGCF